jgi:ornithine carbamoyltransferase
MRRKRDVLSITDLTRRDILDVLAIAGRLKKQLKKSGRNRAILKGKTLIQIYEKPSLRTHASFDIGMFQLGGHALYLGPEHIGLGKRESIEHAANVLSRMGDAIMARVFDHKTLIELAKYSLVPVINGLSDLEHPCQILADLLTMVEYKKRLTGLHITFVGDGENNIPHSLALASGLLGMHFTAACPKGYTMKPKVVAEAKALAPKYHGRIAETHDPKAAVQDADVVYTDTWISMGDEKEKNKRLQVFKPYQINATLMARAQPAAIFMHDMPAYLGNEVTKEVFDSPQSVVYDQAENRLHAQKGLLVFLLKKRRK